MGGHSPHMRFFWQVSWAQLRQPIVDKITRTLNKGNPVNIHINWLEYATAVINYAAIIVAAQPKINKTRMLNSTAPESKNEKRKTTKRLPARRSRINEYSKYSKHGYIQYRSQASKLYSRTWYLHV
jgi:hypothetical protein